MKLWDNLCIHAVYHGWNPLSLVLNDVWATDVYLTYGPTYPGWQRR